MDVHAPPRCAGQSAQGGNVDLVTKEKKADRV